MSSAWAKQRGALLTQALQRGLFRPVVVVVNKGVIRRPFGPPADGLHARCPRW